jgi:hypothetical protein
VAILVEIPRRKCQRPGCVRPATVTLFNRANVWCGDFCYKCGVRAERDLQAREERLDATETARIEASILRWRSSC